MTHPAIITYNKYYERVRNHSLSISGLIAKLDEEAPSSQKQWARYEKMLNTFQQINKIFSSLCMNFETKRYKAEGACE